MSDGNSRDSSHSACGRSSDCRLSNCPDRRNARCPYGRHVHVRRTARLDRHGLSHSPDRRHDGCPGFGSDDAWRDDFDRLPNSSHWPIVLRDDLYLLGTQIAIRSKACIMPIEHGARQICSALDLLESHSCQVETHSTDESGPSATKSTRKHHFR